MEYAMSFIDWKEMKRPNGFLLLEMITALLIISIATASCIPLIVQMAQNIRRGEVWEELSRQKNVVEETIYGTLRFSHDITVKADEIRCRDIQNNSTGFIVKGSRIYRLLSDGSEQPLTGSSSAGMSASIRIRPYGNMPYFSRKGDTIYVSFLVYDAIRHVKRPCLIAVASIAERTVE